MTGWLTVINGKTEARAGLIAEIRTGKSAFAQHLVCLCCLQDKRCCLASLWGGHRFSPFPEERTGGRTKPVWIA